MENQSKSNHIVSLYIDKFIYSNHMFFYYNIDKFFVDDERLLIYSTPQCQWFSGNSKPGNFTGKTSSSSTMDELNDNNGMTVG